MGWYNIFNRMTDGNNLFKAGAPSVSAGAPIHPRPVGGSANPLYGGYPDPMEPNPQTNPDKWIGSPGRPGIAQSMMRDPHVRASVAMICNPLQNAVWDFAPASDDPIDLEVADFLRHTFFERLNFDKFVRQLVTGYLRDGVALFEMTDDVVRLNQNRFTNHPGKGLAVATTGMHYRPAWSIYKFNQAAGDPNSLISIEQQIPGSDRQKSGIKRISAKRCMRWTFEQEDANFWGFPVLRSAYGPFKCKRALRRLQMIKSERMAVPTPKLELPEDADAESIEVAENILRDLKSQERGYIITPYGYTFSYEGIDGNTGAPIEDAIEACNRDIMMNIMAGWFLLGLSSGSSSGSYALANTQQGQFQIAIETHSRFVASIFNSENDGHNPLKRLVEMNYGPNVEVPRMYFRNIPTKDWTGVLPVVNALTSQAGIITADDQLEDFVREALALPKRDLKTSRVAPQATQLPQENEDNEE